MSGPLRPPRWAERLLALVLPRGLSREGTIGDLEEELRARAARTSPAAARRWYARQALGISARAVVASVIVGAGGGARAVAQEMEHARKALRRAPGFLLLAGGTLALGVGATTAIFSVVDAVLLSPLPFADPDRLVTFTNTHNGGVSSQFSEPEILDVMAEREAFQAVAAFRVSEPTFALGESAGEPERIQRLWGSASLLPLLGVEPELGRLFTEAEDQVDSPDRVAVLSHGLWTRAFGADPGAVGRTVLLEDVPHTVIGVMPAEFAFPDPSVQLWTPIRLDKQNPWTRNNHWLQLIARTADDATPGAVAARLSALAARSGAAFPDFYPNGIAFAATPLLETMVGEVRAPLLLLMGAVVLVLLIASVNAASLFLARGEARRGEVSVRTALGASRGRVAAQLLGESLLVALLAAVLGTALAYGGVAALARLAPAELPRVDQIGVDGRVLAFGLLIALVTGVAFGVAPAAQAWRSDARAALTAQGRSAIGGRRTGRFRRGLVVTQLALAMMLALGAGLLVRTFDALRREELGFTPAGVLVLPLNPPASVVAEDTAAVLFYAGLEERLAALPGVDAVGSALRIPLADGHDNYSIQVEGRPLATIGEAPAPGMEWATPGYFGALGIPLRRGRLFTAADHVDAQPVAVVSERLAGELWPGEEAVGKRLRMFNEESPWMEVVGVVADVKHYGVRAAPSTKLYIPHLQGYRAGYYSPARMAVFLRSSGDPAALAPAARAIVRELAPRMPIGEVRPMADVVGTALAGVRFTLTLLAGFAAGALLLAAVGVYGVIAQAVASRTREIGVRMAIGADRGRILRQVLAEGAALALLGVALGAAGGLAAGRLLGAVLYEVTPSDPVSLGAAGALLAAAVLLATAVPALRASRLDPMGALRE